MRIVDNRYKIESLLERDIGCEYYLVSDLTEGNAKRVLTLFEYGGNEEYVEYLVNNYREIRGVIHKHLKQTLAFNLIENIDGRSTGLKLYYFISNYVEGEVLCNSLEKYSENQRLSILADVLSAIDYLHFRGFIYGVLSPEEIFISKNNKAFISDLATASIKKNRTAFDEYTKSFFAPELLMNKDAKGKHLDYYSIEALYAYMFDEEKNIDEIRKLIGEGKDNFVEDRDVLHFDGKIVGRNDEIDLLINEVNAGRSSIITGDFGLGKSRLLREMEFRQSLKGNTIYYKELKSGVEDDLSIFGSMIESVTSDPHSRKTIEYKVELHNILSTGKLNEGARFRLFNRILNYLEEFTTNKKIIFLFDDFHNANKYLIEGVDYFLKNAKSKNIIFIMSYDYSDINKRSNRDKKLAEWIDHGFLTELNLSKLDLEEIGELVKSILGIDYKPEEFSNVLYKESRGNLKYIKHIIQYLYDNDELYIGENGRWHLRTNDYTQIDFPKMSEEDFESQLKQIMEELGDYLKPLSVCDDSIPKDWLLRTIKKRKSTMDKNIKILIDKGFVEEEKRPFGYSYRMKNHEFKRSIYETISEDEKEKLHGELAEFLINSFSLDNFFYLEKVLFHLSKAKQGEKAYNIIRKSVENETFQTGQALRFLWERAYYLTFDKTNEDKLEILDNLLKVYLTGSEIRKSQRFLSEYGKIAEETQNIYHLVRYKARLLDIHYIVSDFEKIEDELKALEDIKINHNYLEAGIVASLTKAKIAIDTGSSEEALEILNQAKSLSEKEEIYSYCHMINNRIGLVKYFKGDYEGASECFFLSIEQAKRANDIFEMTRPLNNLANMYAEVYEDYEKSNEYYRLGIEIANEHDFPEVAIIFYVNLAENYMEAGQFDTALEYLEKVNVGAIELKDYNIELLGNVNMGIIYIMQNKFDKAFEVHRLLKPYKVQGKIANQELLSQYYEFLGLFYSTMGDVARGYKYYRKAQKIAQNYNVKQSLYLKTLIIYQKYIVKRTYDKEMIEEVRKGYQATMLRTDRKRALVNMAIIPFLSQDYEYAKELLDEDASLSTQVIERNTDTIRNILTKALKPAKLDREDVFRNIEKLTFKDQTQDMMFKTMLAYKLYDDKKDKKALRFLFDAMDMCYDLALKIPSDKYRYSFLKFVGLKKMKSTMASILERSYGINTVGLIFEEKDIKNLGRCFDLSPVIKAMGEERFLDLYQTDYYGDAAKIGSIEDLVTNFSRDASYNVDLTLKYMAKLAFATKAMIVGYNNFKNHYFTIASLNEKEVKKINTNLLVLSHDTGGMVINAQMEFESKGINNYTEENVKALMIIPIKQEESIIHTQHIDRRVASSKGRTNLYLYFEADNIFNRINQNSFDMVNKLIKLLMVNIDSVRFEGLASTDKSTKLFTRKYFELKFDELIEVSRTDDIDFSVLMVDIDRFKNVNDSYGHKVGDSVLTEIGAILKNAVRSTDIVGRYGGEEFIIILKDSTEKASLQIGEKIRQQIQMYRFKEIKSPITVSVGISHYPKDGQFKDDLIEKADQALYSAKARGRNRVEEWEAGMLDRRKRTDKLAGIVRGNIEQDNRNLLSLMEAIEIIESEASKEEKLLLYLDKLFETTEAQQGAVLIIEDNFVSDVYASKRYGKKRLFSFKYNEKIVKDLIKTGEGKFLIDWELKKNKSNDRSTPDWQSIIAIPLIKDNVIKGVLYLNCSLTHKEFQSEDFNLAKAFGPIGAALISKE